MIVSMCLPKLGLASQAILDKDDTKTINYDTKVVVCGLLLSLDL